jgi:hypothetical protein
MGFFKSLVREITKPIETVAKVVEKEVIRPAVEVVKEVGRDVDDFVNDVIPGGWGTVAAGAAIYAGGGFAGLGGGGGSGVAGGTAAGLGGADAVTAAEWFGGTGAATAPGAIFGSAAPAAAAVVPSAFETAINTAPTSAPTVSLGPTTELGSFGPVGTAGFGTALPPASEVTAGLIGAGFSPGTAANLAGETAAGVGATNLLGGATAATPLALPKTISVQQALQGARLINSLLTPQQQQTPNMLGRAQEALATQGAVDYSSLLGLLNQRASAAGLLGTRFQPQSINLASLLG